MTTPNAREREIAREMRNKVRIVGWTPNVPAVPNIMDKTDNALALALASYREEVRKAALTEIAKMAKADAKAFKLQALRLGENLETCYHVGNQAQARAAALRHFERDILALLRPKGGTGE